MSTHEKVEMEERIEIAVILGCVVVAISAIAFVIMCQIVGGRGL